MSYPQVRKTAETRKSESNIVSILDMLEAQINNGRAAAPTAENPALATETVKETVTMDRVPKNPGTTKKAIAKEFLELSRTHLEKATSLRIRHAQLAKEYGLTNQQIGDLLGITEARVRQLLKEVS